MKKNIIIIAIVILVISLFIGFCNPLDLKNVIAFKMNWKFISLDLVMYLIALGISFVGIPFYFIILFAEIFIGGVVSAIFISNFAFAGLLLSIILISLKLVPAFFLFLNGFYSLKLIKNNYRYFFKRHRFNKENSKLYLKKMLIVTSILIIISIFELVVSNNLIIPLANNLFF